MTFVIPKHGVPMFTNGMSAVQTKLLKSSSPLRICGAPTGAGKTYAFLEGARQGQFIIFVVPTQALAKDIEQTTLQRNIPAYRWDAIQSKTLVASGADVWSERLQQVKTLRKDGGLLVTTLESLAQVIHGRPVLSKIPLYITDLTLADHLVFDEAHTLTERGFGFLNFWLTLIAHRHIEYPNEPQIKITLLSATHSNLWEAWFDDTNDPLPRSLLTQMDEQLTEEASPNVRWLHGDVQITVSNSSIFDLFLEHGVPFMRNHADRVLLLYDSLSAMIRDLRHLSSQYADCGLSHDEIFVINAQDRQSPYTLGQERFSSGLQPDSHHRLIIGTSAIEMGVNFQNLSCAFIEPGFDGASLIQRIGRVARGSHDGAVWISIGERDTPAHVQLMKDCEGFVAPRQLV